MKRDVLVVAHSHYPSDPRIRKEVAALLDAGRSVDILCLRGSGEKRREKSEALRVWRLPVARNRQARLTMYVLEYGMFMLLAAAAVPWIWLRGRHSVVQTHTLPDPLVLTGLIPQFFGARLVLDMHELTPEFFSSRTRLPWGHPVIRLLLLLEKLSCRVADHIITVSEPVGAVLQERGVPADKITIVMNTSQARRSPPTARADGGPFTLVYAGLVSELYDLTTALHAFAILAHRGCRDIALRVVGDGPQMAALQEATEELGLSEQVLFHGRVQPETVPELLENADAALVPLAAVPYMEFALPTKVFEAIAAGLPVITTRFRTVRHYFGEDALCFVEPANAEALAARLLELRDDVALREQYARRGSMVARSLSWESQVVAYLEAMQCSGDTSMRRS